MSRRVRFTPYFDKQTKKWSVSIPPQLSKTGKRARLFYDTREEALRDSRTLKDRQQKFGVSLSNLDPVRLGEASEAYKRLDALGTSYSLISIVQGSLSRPDRKTVLGAFWTFSMRTLKRRLIFMQSQSSKSGLCGTSSHVNNLLTFQLPRSQQTI
jgi:hypothetical protein